jgi:hypothetical protein
LNYSKIIPQSNQNDDVIFEYMLQLGLLFQKILAGLCRALYNPIILKFQGQRKDTADAGKIVFGDIGGY